MGRPRKGAVDYVKAKRGQEFGHYRARILLADGSRTRLNFEPEPASADALERAKERAQKISNQFQEVGIGLRPKVPTHLDDPGFDSAWWERFFALRDELLMTRVRGRYRKYIQPRLAQLGATIGSLSPKDCESIRNSLDTLVAAKLCSGDTAGHAWHLLSTACRAACGEWRHDRRRMLKIRDTNPCAGILPPKPAERKELQWLYPDEFLALVSCEKVPLVDRRRYAIATYLFCRAGEFALIDLSSGDLDLTHGVVSIRRSWDRERKRTKLTKTGGKGSRRFSIEPALLPLLRAMHRETGGAGRLCPSLQSINRWPERLREHMKLAGITRPELYETDATRKQMRFHDLRATGLTWLALRRESPIAIHVRAGHAQWKMTEAYIRVAETVGQMSVGEVFPELPRCLLGKVEPAESPTAAETRAFLPPRELASSGGARCVSATSVPGNAVSPLNGVRCWVATNRPRDASCALTPTGTG